MPRGHQWVGSDNINNFHIKLTDMQTPLLAFYRESLFGVMNYRVSGTAFQLEGAHAATAAVTAKKMFPLLAVKCHQLF